MRVWRVWEGHHFCTCASTICIQGLVCKIDNIDCMDAEVLMSHLLEKGFTQATYIHEQQEARLILWSSSWLCRTNGSIIGVVCTSLWPAVHAALYVASLYKNLFQAFSGESLCMDSSYCVKSDKPF